MPIKSTVSKIKEMQNEGIDFESLNNKEIGIASITPEFMEKDEVITASRKGTLMHLFLQKIDFKEEYSIQKLNELKEKLVANQIILEEESNFINIYKIQKFLESDIANKIRKCKKIEKEKAFCIKIKASDVYEEAKDEEILVQGIIDLYAIDEKDNVILLDYKTDYVQNGNEEILIQKYQKQLQLYKQAIENGLNLKVSQVYLYSLYLNKDIEVKIM